MSVRDQKACVKPPLSQSPEKFKQYLNRKIRAIAADEGRDRSERHRDLVSVTRAIDPRAGMGRSTPHCVLTSGRTQPKTRQQATRNDLGFPEF